MPMSLGQYLNKTVLVSIPALCSDGQPCACTLAGIEAGGVWLRGDLPFPWLPSNTTQTSAASLCVFVPFTQIAYLLDAAGIAIPNRASAQPVAAASSPKAETRRKQKK